MTSSYNITALLLEPCHKLFPGPANFERVQDFMHTLNADSTFKQYDLLRLLKNKVVIDIESVSNNVKLIEINLNGLQHHLGFTEQVICFVGSHQADRLSDMTRGTHHFYIYCSLLNNVVINNKILYCSFLATR